MPCEIIDFVVGRLKLTPRGRYNLACYHSNAAQTLALADWTSAERLHLLTAAAYLGEALASLDAAMLAWARTDPDLTWLRRRAPDAYRQALRMSLHYKTRRDRTTRQKDGPH
jgi:hypothetical protein